MLIEIGFLDRRTLVPVELPDDFDVLNQFLNLVLGKDYKYREVPPRGRSFVLFGVGTVNKALTNAYGYTVTGDAVVLSADWWHKIRA